MSAPTTQELAHLVELLLGLDPEAPLHARLRVADQAHHSIAHLLLSLWESGGDVALSPAAEDVLRRQRERVSLYRQQEKGLKEAGVRFRVVKGQGIADLYPPGALRSQTDLDVIVDSIDDLWTAVGVVHAGGFTDDVRLTLIGGDGDVQLYVALIREAEDPFYDKPLSVEISTVVHFGNLENVPPRPGLAADPLLANILALCEERFQRKFHARDVIDLDLLSRALPSGSAARLHAEAVRLRLLPELRELLRLADSAGAATALMDGTLPDTASAETAEEERRTRELGKAAPELLFGVRVTEEPVTERLRSNTPLSVDGHRVLATPIGAFLLVTGHAMSQEEYADGRRAVEAYLSGADDLQGKKGMPA